MKKLLRIIHCSDLHLDPDHLKDCQTVLDAFKKDLENITKEGRQADLLLFTGDLVNKGINEKAFDIAKTDFLQGALAAAGLSSDRYCIVPGNHDVALNKINEYFEQGITTNLTSREKINEFIDNYVSKHAGIVNDRFKNFFEVLPEREKNTLTLHRTKVFSFSYGKIGVAMINSAWHATGKSNDFDHGKLIVGERQVDTAADDIKECDFKIAMMHHPLDWLTPTDKTSVIRSLQRNFDLLLFGHSHYQDPVSLVGLAGRFIQSQTGCLYHNREYFNGYSILEIDFDRKKIDIEMREYYDERRIFDKALRFAESGKVTYSIQQEHGAIDLVLSEEAETAYHETVNKRLISAVAAASAPKNIRELFVSPVITTSPGQESVSEDVNEQNQLVKLDELMRDARNVVIHGQKETGKTTLMNYLAIESLPGGRYYSGKLPLRLQFSDIGKSAATILEGIRKTSGSAIEIRQIRAALKNAKAILFIDDLNTEQLEQLEALSSFINEFPGNRVVCTSRFDPIKNPIDLSTKIKTETKNLYLKYFNRKQVKELTSRWVRKGLPDVRTLVDKILITANRINAPTTPLLISVLLWLHEREISFEPVNQAVLLQTFVRELMGKLGGQVVRRGDLDIRNIEHFLGHLAEFFSKEMRESAGRLEVERVALGYFSRFDLSLLRLSVGEVIGDLITRGILVESDAGIGFRYRCFFEYFAALRMSDEREFYEEATAPENVLRFSREIDMYSALNRNDAALLHSLIEKSSSYFNDLIQKYELHGFEKLPLPLNMEKNLSHEEIKKDLEASRLDDEERDSVFDVVIQEEDDQCPASIQTDREHYYPGELLDLVSRVLRNSELITMSDDQKKELTFTIFNFWALLLAEIMVETEKHAEKGGIPEEFSRIGAAFPLVLVPQMIISICGEALGSAKLGHIFRAISDDSESPPVIRIISALVYFELGLEKRIDTLRSILPIINEKKFLLGMTFVKLRMTYSFGNYRREEEDALLNLLTDYYLAIQNLKNLKQRELAEVRMRIQQGLKKSTLPPIIGG